MGGEKKPQEQLGRYSLKELKLVKSTFAEQTDLLIAIRKVLWQKELTDQEDIKLKAVLKPEIADTLSLEALEQNYLARQYRVLARKATAGTMEGKKQLFTMIL